MPNPELSLLLSEDAAAGTALLTANGFADPRSARRAIRRMADTSLRFPLVFAHLWIALIESADPDRVLGNVERFLHASRGPAQTLSDIADHPRAVDVLVRIFSSSQYLAEILLRNPELLELLLDPQRLAAPRTTAQLFAEAISDVDETASASDALDALRRFQRRELLRIGASDLLDLFDLPTATRQLSNLADALTQAGLFIAARPSTPPAGFAVIGMGKLGGQELNYSSDVDYLFLADSPSPAVTRLGEKLIDALGRVTTEGFLYRVDLRLRPWGRVGPLVSSPDGFIAYLKKHAQPWEKQALLKARVVAGDARVGEEFLRRARALIFNETAEHTRAALWEMKLRTEALARGRSGAAQDVKLGEGSIRDVEFCAQYLQITHAAQMPKILTPSTLEALDRLSAAGLLDTHEHRTLTDGYIFLRTIEHHLQLMDFRQTHVLPDDPNAITSLARRLGFHSGQGFLQRYRRHARAVRAIFLRHVGSAEIKETRMTPLAARSQPLPSTDSGSPSGGSLGQHQARMDASYAETFDAAEIARHVRLANSLAPQRLAAVEAQSLPQGDWRVTVVAYDAPGELSLICGLMVVYGMNILKGDVFTYEPADGREPAAERKIVDVFTVSPLPDAATGDFWEAYARDLQELLTLVRAGSRREARGQLARRVAAKLAPPLRRPPESADFEEDLRESTSDLPLVSIPEHLTAVEITFDNDSSARYTALHIDGVDTPGFLYELTNALAIDRVDIVRMTVGAVGARVRDTLFVTDENGRKIIDADKQRELRAATSLIKHFTHLLPYSPNPESAMLHFREFIAQLFKNPRWPDELASLERPEVLHALARLLGMSDFLWDDFLRMQYANLFPVVRDVDALAVRRSRDELQAELAAALQTVRPIKPERPYSPQGMPEQDSPWYSVLNDFKDREMFRIDMRHIIGRTREFWEFASELSDLAEVVVNAAYHLCHEDLRLTYGTPRLADGTESLMTVAALGKCGGRELGFASDIELMFIYSGNGMTDGAASISTTEFYEKLITRFVRAIRARREGIFEIDLRLRPYGKAGSLSVSLEAFKRYFAPAGPAWGYERQSLVKLRAIAGDEALGRVVEDLRDEFVYTGTPFDVTAMRAMRERQVRHLVAPGTFNLKYSPGGLADVEYLVQGLQINHGAALPALRSTNTREAMAALHQAGVLSDENYARLRKSHTFLRWMIDGLRVVRGNAKDITVPDQSSEEFAYLARRMPYDADPARLAAALAQYTQDVMAVLSVLE